MRNIYRVITAGAIVLSLLISCATGAGKQQVVQPLIIAHKEEKRDTYSEKKTEYKKGKTKAEETVRFVRPSPKAENATDELWAELMKRTSEASNETEKEANALEHDDSNVSDTEKADEPAEISDPFSENLPSIAITEKTEEAPYESTDVDFSSDSSETPVFSFSVIDEEENVELDDMHILWDKETSSSVPSVGYVDQSALPPSSERTNEKPIIYKDEKELPSWLFSEKEREESKSAEVQMPTVINVYQEAKEEKKEQVVTPEEILELGKRYEAGRVKTPTIESAGKEAIYFHMMAFFQRNYHVLFIILAAAVIAFLVKTFVRGMKSIKRKPKVEKTDGIEFEAESANEVVMKPGAKDYDDAGEKGESDYEPKIDDEIDHDDAEDEIILDGNEELTEEEAEKKIDEAIESQFSEF